MRNYPSDSPEAMAQLLTALMAADDRIDDAEVEALSMLDAYSRIGISPPAFADVLRDYFTTLDSAPDLERIAGRITDDRLRALLWDIMVGLAVADEDISTAETDFLQQIARLWWRGALPSQLSMPGGGQPRPALQSMTHALRERAGAARWPVPWNSR
jgi:uncharacterized tellurite resistance protein B-like protein